MTAFNFQNRIHLWSYILFVYFLLTCTTAENSRENRRIIENTLLEIETVKLPEMERLFRLCDEKKISTNYEKVDYTVVRDFTAYVRDDMRAGNIERAVYALACLEAACNDVVTALNAYLDGAKEPKEVTRYVTGKVEISGGSLIGKAKNFATGMETIRPLFFTGYGHFDQIINDMPKMTSYGVDILQTEIGPRSTVTPDGVNLAEIERIETILRDAEKNNVRVDVLLSPHYFPDWTFRKYPHLREDTGNFIAYNIYEPEAKKVIEAHISAVMDRIKNYTSLNSVCISNEPVFSTAKNFNVRNKYSTVNVMWRQYLIDTHGNIETLNKIYRSRYKDFDTVPMPKKIEATPQFYDWMTFNDKAFGDWHEWMAELVNKAGVPVHSKVMNGFLSPAAGKSSLTWGVDPQRFAEFSRLNGNDSYNLLFNPDGDIGSKMKWYDFLTSLKKMPVYNSEDHIIADRSGDYIPQQVQHVRSDLWQGAVHGRAASTVWVWERTHRKDSDFAGSVLHRPDVVSAIGKTNLDLNRLAYELTALQNEPAYTAIFYSNPARVYDEEYIRALSEVYAAITYNGVKAGFITEKQLASGEFGAYRIIFIPAAVHCMPETLGAIRNFINSGGKVVIIDGKSLSKDHYDRDIANADRAFIMENSAVLKISADYTDTVRTILTSAGLCAVTLKDRNTDAPVYGVEWLSAIYNGKPLINLCNYEWGESKPVSVFINNRPAGDAVELITGVAVNAANIELPPFTPVLLSVN